MKSSLALLVVFLAAADIVSAQLPIPTRPLGFSVGEPGAPVVLDAYFDLMCPDSRSIWPGVRDTIEHYGSKNIRFNLLPFALPYHHNSYYANQGAVVVGAAKDSAAVYKYMELVYKHQESFNNAPTFHSAPSDVQKALANLVEEEGIMSAADFIKGLTGSSSDNDTRTYWKYACSRAVAGTPTMMVNGVVVQASLSWGVKEWSQVLDPLIHPTMRSAAAHRLALVSDDDTCPSGTERCDYLPGKHECCTKGHFCVPNVGCRC